MHSLGQCVIRVSHSLESLLAVRYSLNFFFPYLNFIPHAVSCFRGIMSVKFIIGRLEAESRRFQTSRFHRKLETVGLLLPESGAAGLDIMLVDELLRLQGSSSLGT